MSKKDLALSPPARPELSDTPLKFCNEIARLFRGRMRAMDDGGAMSQPGAHLVLSLLAMDDGICQRDLVVATHLRPPTVSVLLRDMEEEGLVKRKGDPDDQRAVRVYLTEKGRARDRQNIEKIHALDEIGLRGLSDEEIKTLMALLVRLRDNLLKEREDCE